MRGPDAPSVDLARPQRIHVVGIGGAGMSAIATVLAAMGHRVSGSDLKATQGLDRLRALGVTVAVGHDASQVEGADAVAVSTAIPARNAEVAAAAAAGIPVLRRAEILAAVVATRRAVAVAGTHGKTTTSSMLALALRAADFRPSFLIGGELNEIGSGAAWTDGEWLVVEADESDGTFLELAPEAVVVTSVEPDHLEHYGGDVAGLVDAFERFVAGAPGPRVVCADDPGAARLAFLPGTTSYGTAPTADYAMTDVAVDRASARFTVSRRGERLGTVSVPVPGLYNARNACGALAAAHLLGAPFDAAAAGLARYGGVARRYQFRGTRAGVTLVDDYAHLPGEVRAVLAAARLGGWSRVVCVFQPHRFSRTAALAASFAGAFDDADQVVVTDVYPSGEAPRPGVTGRLVADAAARGRAPGTVHYVARREEWAPAVAALLRDGDVCLTLGAGDITLLAADLLDPSGPLR